MRITYDPAKRAQTIASRGLDFADAWIVLEGECATVQDIRKDYGEQRFICYGVLRGRLVVVGYTPRGADCHVFSMRNANEREKRRYAHLQWH